MSECESERQLESMEGNESSSKFVAQRVKLEPRQSFVNVSLKEKGFACYRKRR